MAEQKDRRSGSDRRRGEYDAFVFEPFARYEAASRADWTPMFDVGETDTALILRADIPGIRQTDVHIEFDRRDGILTIAGERAQPEGAVQWHNVERPRGSFSRSFSLPGTVDPESVSATYHDGVLEVTISKKEAGPAKQIRLYVETTSDAAARQAERNADARAALFREFCVVRLRDLPKLEPGRVFSVPSEGEEWVPRFELDEQKTPLPVIAAVLSHLGGLRTPWELALWFTSANGWLDGARPVDLLTSDPDRVVEAARHEAEERVF